MPNRAVFLDRDDTLIEDPGYINHPDQVKLLDGVAEALIELKTLGYRLIVVSNQSAVARGIVTEKVLGEIHDRLQQLLAEKGTRLDGIYYCPYHPEAVVARYRQESDWRKPSPGMLLAAAEQMQIDLRQSWMIGNSDSDIEAGSRAGCRTIRINPPSHAKQTDAPSLSAGAKPDFTGVNMKEAVNIIKKYHRSVTDLKSRTQSLPEDQTLPGLEVEEQPQTVETPQPKEAVTEQESELEKTDELLSGILEQLKKMQRADMFGEFSIMRLLAGIIQIIVLFCLLMAVWFLTSPAGRNDAVLTSLGFAAVFQLMSLTFYVMQGRR